MREAKINLKARNMESAEDLMANLLLDVLKLDLWNMTFEVENVSIVDIKDRKFMISVLPRIIKNNVNCKIKMRVMQ